MWRAQGIGALCSTSGAQTLLAGDREPLRLSAEVLGLWLWRTDEWVLVVQHRGRSSIWRLVSPRGESLGAEPGAVINWRHVEEEWAQQTFQRFAVEVGVEAQGGL